MTIEEAVSRVRPLDAAAMRAAEKRFSDIAMPLGGLGLLQDAIIQLAGIQRKPVPIIRPRAAVIFCADNGVVAEGVTQCGQDVTATVTRNMGQGRSTMCMMAKSIDMDVFPVDIGVAEKFSFKGVVDKKIRKRTAIRGTAHGKQFHRKTSEYALFLYRKRGRTASHVVAHDQKRKSRRTFCLSQLFVELNYRRNGSHGGLCVARQPSRGLKMHLFQAE